MCSYENSMQSGELIEMLVLPYLLSQSKKLIDRSYDSIGLDCCKLNWCKEKWKGAYDPEPHSLAILTILLQTFQRKSRSL